MFSSKGKKGFGNITINLKNLLIRKDTELLLRRPTIPDGQIFYLN